MLLIFAVLVMSNVWLLKKSFVLLVIPSFLSVTFTVAVPLDFDKPSKEMLAPPLDIVTWSSVNGSVVPSE